MRFFLTCIFSLLIALPIRGQFEPESAHVFLFFPQLADGGNFEQSWQTSVVLQNPSEFFNADCRVSTLTPDGQPLYLNLGMGVNSAFNVSIPPNGRRNLRSTIGARLVTGWAVAECNVPVQGTVLFRRIDKGIHAVEISAAGVSPTPAYRSVGNGNLGVALSNMNSHSIDIEIIAYGANGSIAGARYLTLCSLCQTSATLRELMNNLPQDFEGSVTIMSAKPRTNAFAAWTLNEDRGLISSLPAGNASFPISQYDRIWLIFQKLIHFADRDFPHLNLKATRLVVSSAPDINASASSGTTVTINLALAQLIGDSPSELAFAIAHEIGHIIQHRSGYKPIGFSPNLEHDADALGVLLVIEGGYDPYGAAGLLGKLGVSGQRLTIEDLMLSDLLTTHQSFLTRMRKVNDLLISACSSPQLSSSCAEFQKTFHPNFPPHMPLQEGLNSSPTEPATPAGTFMERRFN